MQTYLSPNPLLLFPSPSPSPPQSNLTPFHTPVCVSIKGSTSRAARLPCRQFHLHAVPPAAFVAAVGGDGVEPMCVPVVALLWVHACMSVWPVWQQWPCGPPGGCCCSCCTCCCCFKGRQPVHHKGNLLASRGLQQRTAIGAVAAVLACQREKCRQQVQQHCFTRLFELHCMSRGTCGGCSGL